MSPRTVLSCATVLLVLASAVAPAQQILDWVPGAACRVVVPGTGIALLGKTRKAGLALARLCEMDTDGNDTVSHKNVVAGVYAKDVVKTSAGLHANILELIFAEEDERRERTPFLKVKVQSGPLKGIYYTPWAYTRGHYLEDETLILVGAHDIAGAFDRDDIEHFYDAFYKGDDSLWRGYITLGEVITMRQGTRVKVLYSNTAKTRSDSVWVRVVSGPKSGKSVYVPIDHTMFAYDLPASESKSPHKVRKG